MESTNCEKSNDSKTTNTPPSQTDGEMLRVRSKLNRRRAKRIDRETGELRLSDTQFYQFKLDDLINHGEFAYGNTSTIFKMTHKMSETTMAAKLLYVNEYENYKKIRNELNIFMCENICPHILQFYGILFDEFSCWICMELMTISLDDFYHFVYDKINHFIPENILTYIALIILETLDYLKSRWKIIHKNVQPSNILMSPTTIKISNFGIIDKNLHGGYVETCTTKFPVYSSPEYILGKCEDDDSNIRSSVWSLGITIYEISVGYFPIREYKSIFDMMTYIVKGLPLELTSDRLSDHCKNFVNICLIRDVNQRATYEQLLDHPFLEQPKQTQQTEYITNYLSDIIDRFQQNIDTSQ